MMHARVHQEWQWEQWNKKHGQAKKTKSLLAGFLLDPDKQILLNSFLRLIDLSCIVHKYPQFEYLYLFWVLGSVALMNWDLDIKMLSYQ